MTKGPAIVIIGPGLHSRPARGEATILGGHAHRRLTIASILALTGLLLIQTVDPALAGVVLPSGAGTLTIGPQAMEGNLQIHPGDTIKAGYDFTMPGAHAPAQVTVDNASITMGVTCGNGTAPPPITFALPVQTYSDPAGSPSWYPSGDQASAAVYQGSLTAPDLCAGGIMADAQGATFQATVFSTDTSDRVNVRFHYSDNTAGSWSATITASPTPTAKTVLSATLTPSLGLTLAVDHPSAIPGDTLTYSGTVTNTGATLTLSGDFTASATGTSTATVQSYWDDVATSLDATSWTALAGTAAAQSGYTPAVAPPVSSGLSLTASPATVTGVTYPSSGDPLLGTTMASGSSALWHYTASVPLTPSQVLTLLDPTKVKAVRNSFHLEVSPANPSVTQPSVINVDFSGIFFGGSPAPSGAVTNIVVAVQPPSGSPNQITSAQVSGLASLAPGASASYSAPYQVPAVAAKGTTETDAAYLARLKAIEGTTLTASATASGSSTGGPLTASAAAVSTTEHLPIMTITKSGPATVPAGTTGTYPLALQNTGGAAAGGITITDSVPSGATGTVSGIPTTLAPGASSSGTQAVFPVPVNQSAGSLTDTASLTWRDANANAYGPVSSLFTTQVQAANKLSLTGGAGPNPTGAREALKATLVDLNGQPVANQNVTLNVAGPNAQQSTVTTDASGVASFSYLGANVGTDTLQASTVNGVQSNTLTVTWFTPIQKVSSSAVQGNFYAEPSNPQSFAVTAQSVPDFGQTFPTIDFNPPAGTIPHSPTSAPTDQTRPFTDVTTDVNGNYNGTIVAQGNGLQAGQGTLTNFDGVFTANLLVGQPGDVTFNFYVDDGFLFGVGNGSTRVSGVYENPPVSNLSAIQGYPLMGAFNLIGAGTRPVTVHFPAAGTYPYELDYFEANGGALSLVMTVASFTAQTNPLSVYVGYADGLRPAGSIFPFPWQGSSNVTFNGCNCTFDAGAIRFDNSSSNPITLDSVTVDVGGAHFDLWGRSLTVPAGQILILTETANDNFDTSDFSGASCGSNNGVIPKVNVTQGGVTTSFNDTNQILNTFGFDLACRGNESQSWQRIGGGGSTINVPLPPATMLALTPATVTGKTVGQTQPFTVSAMDAMGQPVTNLPVTLAIVGANGSGTLNGATLVKGTTDSSGLARLSYVGINAGTDTAQVMASVMGLRTLSNTVSVPWSFSATPTGGAAPAPAITNPSPPDGTTVTKPVPISAIFAPPAGQSITSWSVTYQDQDPSAPVALASGTGTPPATLATFDPTLLPNDTYVLTISATASGGGTQTLTTSVIVYGNLKLGRYVTTYQDLSVPVNGFQMEVRRTYDSIDKHVGDFGVGWHVDLVNFRTTTNRQLGAGGWTQYNTLCGLGLCLTAFKTSAPHFVTVVFPDGHSELFDFTPTGGSNVFLGGGAAFTARPGTTSTLAADGDPSLGYQFDGNLYSSNGQPYDPQRFRLTTHDGRVLLLDRTTGLVSKTDRNGNSITISAAGVAASNGSAITYTRDATSRITQISGPNNQTLTYTYSAAGDLATSTDPNGNTTTYAYDAKHDLLKATGPAGAQPLTTLNYDAGGRLVSVTDGNGNTTQVNNNVAGQQQTVTDATGKLTTVYTLDDLGDILRQDQVFDGKTLTSTATYDAVGRPLTRTDPLGRAWTGSYNANGDLLQLSTPQANSVGITYDSNGFPLTFADPLGNLTKYGYDGNGNLTTFTNALAQSDAYAYDAQGHPTSRTDALGDKWSYTYDAAGHQTSMTDPLGNATHYTYDGSGHLTSTTDPTGAVSTYTYNAAGNLTSTKDALGQVTSIAFDALGRMSSRTDAGGNKSTYAYDGNNALTSVTDPLGRVTKYAYDADGRLTTVTDPAGGVTTYSYDGAGRLASQRDALGRTASYSYDNAGRLASKTMPNGGVFTYAYNADGYQTSVTDPLGHTTSTVYDAAGRVTSSTDALGKTTAFTLDALGRVTKAVDPLGQASTEAYDAAGRLTSATDALGHATTSSYDAVGNRVGVTDPLGHATTYAYDAAGRLVRSTDPLGRTTSLAYDALGRLTSTTLPSGNTSTYGYDALGHETAVRDPLGNTGSYAYDAAGQRTMAIDARSDATTYGYDAAGHLTSITDALGGKVSLTVDGAGQQTAIANPRGDTTRFTYDSLGNLATQTDPAGGVTTFAYDAGGRLTARTDPRGITVTSGYDADNRLTSTSFPGGSIAQTYDALGRRIAMTDPLGTTTFSYDAASKVTAVAAPQGIVAYAYDAAGRRASMTVPGSRTVGYGYDAGNQLTSLTDWLGQASSFIYGADGMLTGMSRPGGLQTSYGYDAADRLTSVNNDGPGGALKHFSYTLDASGNRTSVTSGAGTESYTIDALNRITSATYPNGDKVTYSYDAAGNRTSQTVNGVTTSSTYDAGGRLIQAGATTYRYDAAGNLVGAGADSFSWDWAGRLAGATAGGTTSSYSYDGDGTRVAVQLGPNSTSYLWDRQSSLPVLVDDGSHGYLQSPSGGVLEQLTSGGAAAALYPLPDALGSVRGLANATGGLAGSTDYDVYGGVRSTSGSSGIFGFTGQQTDATSLLYLRARYYNPVLGRFVSPDTVFPNAPGTPGYNLYSYVANDPTRLADPTGHFAVDTGIAEEAVAIRDAAAATAVGVAVNLLLLRVVLIIALIGAASTVICPCSGVLPTSAPAPATPGGATVTDPLTRLTDKIMVATDAGNLTLTEVIARARARNRQSSSVAVDASALIAGLQEGQYADLEAALATRQPVVSPTAFVQSTVKTGPGQLTMWLAEHSGRQGPAVNDLEAAALVNLAPQLNPPRALGVADAKIALSAMKEFLPLIARDDQLLGFLQAIGYPVQPFPRPSASP